MAKTEAQKRATQKWDEANMLTLSCRLRKDQVEAFRQKCSESGSNANTILKEFILSYIGESEEA